MSALDAPALRRAFGAFPTGVTVVTTRADDGTPAGFTANSFSSVSLDPPLLLVCPARTLSTFPVFQTCRAFAVNVLSEGQEEISNIFAGFKGDRFARISWHEDESGCPLIENTAARFSCRVHQRVDAGDHLVLIGRIDRFSHADTRGLGYAAGGYFSLGLERRAEAVPPPGHRAYAGAIVEHGDGILLEETPQGLRPFQVALDSRAGARAAIGSHLAAIGISAELGPVYSIFDDRRSGESFTYFRAVAPGPSLGWPGRFVPAGDVAGLAHVSPAHADMLCRHALERRTGAFGLYVGDELAGDVHPFPQEAGR